MWDTLVEDHQHNSPNEIAKDFLANLEEQGNGHISRGMPPFQDIDCTIDVIDSFETVLKFVDSCTIHNSPWGRQLISLVMTCSVT
jgi:hypothetical protein